MASPWDVVIWVFVLILFKLPITLLLIKMSVGKWIPNAFSSKICRRSFRFVFASKFDMLSANLSEFMLFLMFPFKEILVNSPQFRFVLKIFKSAKVPLIVAFPKSSFLLNLCMYSFCFKRGWNVKSSSNQIENCGSFNWTLVFSGDEINWVSDLYFTKAEP